jgi:hypothetical protein
MSGVKSRYKQQDRQMAAWTGLLVGEGDLGTIPLSTLNVST